MYISTPPDSGYHNLENAMSVYFVLLAAQAGPGGGGGIWLVSIRI